MADGIDHQQIGWRSADREKYVISYFRFLALNLRIQQNRSVVPKTLRSSISEYTWVCSWCQKLNRVNLGDYVLKFIQRTTKKRIAENVPLGED